MAASATCSSCGLRHPATAYPVSINNATKRAMGTCLSCLQEHVILSEWENAGIRQPTAEENAATIAALNTKKSTKHVTRAVHRRTLKRKRDQVIAASKRASLALADTKKTCRICVEEKELTAFPSSLKRATKRSSSSVEIPPRCQDHLGVKSKDGPVCKSCIAGALTAAIELKGAERTGCFECNAAWDIAFIARYVTAEVSTAYLDMLLKVTLARNSEFIWCINPKCGSGGFAERKREGTGYPQVECGQCKERSCANCKVKWHAGKTCQQFQLTRTDEMTEQEKQALRKLEQVDARRCPKCQMAVEKNGGCPSMYCGYCQSPFDWDLAEKVLSVESASKAEKEKGNEKNPDTPSSTPPKPPQPPVLCEADMRKTGWQMTTQYFGTPGQQLHAMLMTATANASM